MSLPAPLGWWPVRRPPPSRSSTSLPLEKQRVRPGLLPGRGGNLDPDELLSPAQRVGGARGGGPAGPPPLPPRASPNEPARGGRGGGTPPPPRRAAEGAVARPPPGPRGSDSWATAGGDSG